MNAYLKCCVLYNKWLTSNSRRSSNRVHNKMVGTNDYMSLKHMSELYEITNETNATIVTIQMNTSEGVDSIPLGYSLPHIILTTILLTVIMFVIVFGNLLVVIAIFTDKNLKTTQNWFIASLAVADFLLGLVIMPFSLANEMMGYWYFGRVWCDLWKAIDVLLCTASILSICLISLDRYWSITRAIKYSRQRTPKRAALMIAAVWFLSAIICVPPLIGWKNPLPVSDYPLCLLSDDIGYVLYSTMGSFYIPCVIMVFVYFKIYRAARRLARKNIKKKQVIKQVRVEIRDDLQTEFASAYNTESMIQSCHLVSDPPFIKNHRTLQCVDETDSTTANGQDRARENDSRKQNKTESFKSQSSKKSVSSEANSNLSYQAENEHEPEDFDKSSEVESKKFSTKIKHENSSKKRQRQNGNKNTKGWRAASLREHERQKRKIAKARERRATIVLGLVMAAFILCWCPFFTLYIITSFCYCVGEIVFTVVFWAGYCNSALNPIIYTIFNRDFRQAFHRMICKVACRCQR